MLNTGLKPRFVSYVMFSLKVAIFEVSVGSFTGVANIPFYDQSYTTNIALFLSIDLIGNFPVKSTYGAIFRVWCSMVCEEVIIFICCDWQVYISVCISHF